MKKIFKRSLSLLLATTIIFSSAYVGLSEVDFDSLLTVKAQAASVVESGTCDTNLTWILYDDGVLDISGAGYMLGYGSEYETPWWGVHENITHVNIGSGVVSIGYNAFHGCKNLVSVSMADTVLYVYTDAFYGCSSLESITLPDSMEFLGVNAFAECKSLKSITIPASVTIIDMQAFSNCKSLTDVYYKGTQEQWNAISVGDFNESLINATIHYNSIAEEIPKELTFTLNPDGESYSVTYCELSANGGIIIPSTYRGLPVTSIGDSFAFYSRGYLTSITIPDSVTRIGSGAFLGCTNLNSVYITDVAAWCNVIFEDRSSNPLENGKYLYIDGELAKDVVIPEGVTVIPNYAFSCHNITSVTMPESVESIGSYAFYNCTSLTSVTIPDSVTSIGSYAFYKCTSLTSVTIPDNVASIGDSAFYGCENLNSVYITDVSEWCNIIFEGSSSNPLEYGKYLYINGELAENVVIPEGVTVIPNYAFSCDNITSVTMPGSVERIGDNAFFDCKSIKSIIIPSSVKNIGFAAFRACESLVSVTIGDSVTSIGSNAFAGCENLNSVYITDVSAWCNIAFNGACSNPLEYGKYLYINGELAKDVIIPAGVTEIPDYAFSCYNITSVTIPESVERIGANAFCDCKRIESIIIPSSVKSIGNNAFLACESLVSATIGDSVTSISSGAFAGCLNLISVTIGDSVTSIGSYAFEDCDSLESILIPNGVTSIGYGAFSGCSSLISATIGDRVTSIGSYAFENCDSLESILIPNSVTNIGSYSFADCLNLESVTIGNSVTSIEKCAFYGCENLTSITIPDSVTSIGSGVFGECSSLASVIILGSVTTICENTFYDCINLVSITIPISVMDVAKYAFNSCYNIKYVFYEGTEEDWDDIYFGPSNEYLINAFVHYESTDHAFCEEWTTDITPTCSTDGSKSHHCTVCDARADIIVIEAKGHTYGDWVMDEEPDCTETGLKSKTCLICDDVVTDEIEANGHSFSSEWTIDSEPTCSTEGSKSHHCELCGDKADITVIEPTGHTPSEEWEIVEPTCTWFGSKSRECAVCGETTDYIELEATGHTPSEEWEIVEPTCTWFGSKSRECTVCRETTDYIELEPTGHTPSEEWEIVEPTCTEFGSKSRECTVCWETTDYIELEPIGHNMVDDVCQNCGLGSDWKIKRLDDGLEIVGYLGSEVDVVIPATLAGLPVTSIGDSIDGCQSFESITISDNITSIAGGAFSLCSNLTEIIVNENNDYYTSVEGVLFSKDMTELVAYPAGKQAAEYTIPDSVTSIGERAFYSCDNLTFVTIPDSVAIIGREAFRQCTNLTSVAIPDSVTSLGPGAFWVCGLRSVVIGDGITELYPSTFMGCTDLTSVTLPVSLTRVHIGNFELSKNIKYVFYAGTHEQWSKIVLFSSASNLNAAAIHYEATWHTYGDWSITSEATCTEDGSRTKACSVCGDEVTETIVSNGHNYVVQSKDNNHPHTLVSECSFCNDVKSEFSAVSDCFECNFTFTAIDKISYKLMSYIGTETDVVIPASYNDCVVTTIAVGCFKGNTSIASIEIPDTVTSIEKIAFMNCVSLKKVFVPASVTNIGTQAFYGFTGAIYCERGSYAHEYAAANNIKYVLMSIIGNEETQIDYENFLIYTSVQNCSEITEILGLSGNAVAIPMASHVVGNYEVLGTGTVVTVFDGDEYIGDFTLVVEGDTNGDSVCDALDAAQVANASNGYQTIGGAYALAADSNADDIVDIEDYQAIVNKVIA